MRLYVRNLHGDRRPIELGQTPIGGGGEGKIHTVSGDHRLVVKLFVTPDADRRAKVEAMLHCPIMARTVRGAAAFAWPQGIVTDCLGGFRGFAMSRIDTAQYVTLETLLIPAARAKASLTADSPTHYRFRVRVAQNIATAIARAHRAGHAVVDVKPMNIFVHRTSGQVVIVDCDGCRVASPHRVFPAIVATEEYLAPEFHGRVQLADRRQDLFALAMVIFRLLNNDLYPMNGIPVDPGAPASHAERIHANLLTVNPAAPIRQHPKSIQDMLPGELIQLFRSGFSHVAPLRPSALQWVEYLARFEQQLGRCRRVRDHVALPSGCPWCSAMITLASSSEATAPPPPRARSSGMHAAHVKQGVVRPSRWASFAMVLSISLAIILSLGFAAACYAAPSEGHATPNPRDLIAAAGKMLFMSATAKV